MNKELHEHHHDDDCCCGHDHHEHDHHEHHHVERIFRQTTRQRFIPLKIWVVPTVPQRWRAGLTS